MQLVFFFFHPNLAIHVSRFYFNGHSYIIPVITLLNWGHLSLPSKSNSYNIALFSVVHKCYSSLMPMLITISTFLKIVFLKFPLLTSINHQQITIFKFLPSSLIVLAMWASLLWLGVKYKFIIRFPHEDFFWILYTLDTRFYYTSSYSHMFHVLFHFRFS